MASGTRVHEQQQEGSVKSIPAQHAKSMTTTKRKKLRATTPQKRLPKAQLDMKEEKASKNRRREGRGSLRHTFRKAGYHHSTKNASISQEEVTRSSNSELNENLSKAKEPRLVWMQKILDKGLSHLLSRYRDTMLYKSQAATTQVSDANKDKNRYTDIDCIDATRVILRGRKSDYIHANWIVFENGTKFIGSQAPLPSTVEDFWHMVIQENCRTIVMLCKLIENECEKCASYYPTSEKDPVTVGGMKITLTRRTTSPNNNVISVFTIKNRETEFTLRHVHCTTWDDHSAPSDTMAVIEARHEMLKNPSGHPIIVHCSAGVGRTCTLIGVELLLTRIYRRHDATGTQLIMWLRDRRAGAIQKGIQFVFMHLVAIKLMCEEGVMRPNDPKVLEFEKKYQKLLEKQREAQRKMMMKQKGKVEPKKEKPDLIEMNTPRDDVTQKDTDCKLIVPADTKKPAKKEESPPKRLKLPATAAVPQGGDQLVNMTNEVDQVTDRKEKRNETKEELPESDYMDFL